MQIFDVILFFKPRTIQQKTLKPTYLCPLRKSNDGVIASAWKTRKKERRKERKKQTKKERKQRAEKRKTKKKKKRTRRRRQVVCY